MTFHVERAYFFQKMEKEDTPLWKLETMIN